LPLSILVSCIVGAQVAYASQPSFGLEVVPARVFKVDDPGGSNTSSFVFNLAAICARTCGGLVPVQAHVELSSGGSAVVRQDWTARSLAKIKGESYRIGPDTPVASPTRTFALPEAFDLRFYFRNPRALAVDSVLVRLTVADASGRRAERSLRIPVGYYSQKTALMVPLRGLAVVGQDWITNGGHGGLWNGFALDLRGLSEDYGERRPGAVPHQNVSAAGWGREIIAPANGRVIYARNDVPTNTKPGNEPGDDWFRQLHDPVMAFAGNCVVIDHGNSEYSVMMHMQPGSVTVRVGDRVTKGEVIGRLGNSGDSTGPHLHYQLQSGPELFKSQSLPFKFENTDDPLSQGAYVDGK